MAVEPATLPPSPPLVSPGLSFVSRVRAHVHEEQLLRRGDVLVVGVSGRADSVALLHALYRLAGAERLRLVVAHLPQGDSPDTVTDTAFVKELAQELRLSIEIGAEKPQVPELPSGGPSLEQFLEEIRERRGARLIATGETADDVGELLLEELLDPAVMPGKRLADLHPCLTDASHRICPLLPFTHDECRSFLVQENLPFRQDPDALNVRTQRQRLRLLILPMIRRHASPGRVTAGTLAGAARLLGADEMFLEELATLAAAEVTLREEPAGASLHYATWRMLPSPLRWRVLAAAAARAVRQSDRPPALTRDALFRLDASCRSLQDGASRTDGTLKITRQRGRLIVSVDSPGTTL